MKSLLIGSADEGGDGGGDGGGSLCSLISMCSTSSTPPTTDERRRRMELQSLMEEEEDGAAAEEAAAGIHSSEKKRRLSGEQVKALEKNFEVENKLEPERKARLAQDLGLQPRQVAVWFQNRRARWKTKQLEIDYNQLKSNFDSLKSRFDLLHHENDSLRQQVREMRAKVGEGGKEASEPVSGDGKNTGGGSSDSDSSAVLQDDGQLLRSPPSPVTAAYLRLSEMGEGEQKVYQPQFIKMEEHNFFGAEETCSFFSDDQAPSLHWYCTDHWN